MQFQSSDHSDSNQILIPNAAPTLDQMKAEIAQEFGVVLGANQTSRANGSVGGEMTKRLVRFAEQSLVSNTIIH